MLGFEARRGFSQLHLCNRVSSIICWQRRVSSIGIGESSFVNCHAISIIGGYYPADSVPTFRDQPPIIWTVVRSRYVQALFLFFYRTAMKPVRVSHGTPVVAWPFSSARGSAAGAVAPLTSACSLGLAVSVRLYMVRAVVFYFLTSLFDLK